MKTTYKSKAVIVLFLTLSLLSRGTYSAYAKNNIKYGDDNGRRCVIVCGVPVGIRLKSHGVIVTGFISYNGENDMIVSPAKEAGIKEGDRIIGINDYSVEGIDDMQKALDDCENSRILLHCENSRGCFEKWVNLFEDNDSGELKLGIWGRDSVSGIGTLTFYDEKTGSYGALGHGISDGAEPYCISGGSLMAVEITGINKGAAGIPGELRGYFKENENPIGEVSNNCPMGIFGKIDRPEALNGYGGFYKIGVAYNSEVSKGSAYILTSAVDGSVQKYNIEITQINKESRDGTKSYNIRVTDNRLLDVTGGIVQGMSGSPVIQNGKLVGAVTHVLVDDPTRGYAIFAENMLETAQGVAESNKLKEAS